MVRNTRRLMGAAGLSGIALALTLTACGATGSLAPGTTSSLTLTDTKSPTQLLRNVAAGFINSKNIANVTNTEDQSLPCGTDPKVRSWNSAVTVGFDVAHEAMTKATAQAVIDGFKAKGWTPEIENYTDGLSVRLSKTGSVSVIHVQSLPAVVGYKGHGAQVVILVTGPCVQTDGPDSPEVKTLEGRS